MSSELHSIPIKTEVMQQIGIDIYSFPEVDGFKDLVVCIEYFSKWSEIKPIKIKVPPPLLSSFISMSLSVVNR